MKKFIGTCIAFACACGTPASGATIGRNSLIQYQYHVDAPQCNLTLSNGLRIEFDGVFANEGEYVVSHSLVIVGVPTKHQFQFATIVHVSYCDTTFIVKVVKQDGSRVFLALDSTFLNLFWGAEAADVFEIAEVEFDSTSKSESFMPPGDMAAARLALSKGKSCNEAAQAVD